MAKKLLAILGSPRKGGNIAQMLQVLTGYAEQGGWETNTVDVYRANLAFCNGCMACRKKGICVIQDEIADIREKLISCDMLVAAAPTYFANVPAPLKNLFDRLAGALMDDNESPIPKPRLLKKQRYVLLTACTTPFPFNYIAGQSRGTLHAMNEVFKTAGMTNHGTVVLAGSRNIKEIPYKINRKIKRLIA